MGGERIAGPSSTIRTGLCPCVQLSRHQTLAYSCFDREPLGKPDSPDFHSTPLIREMKWRTSEATYMPTKYKVNYKISDITKLPSTSPLQRRKGLMFIAETDCPSMSIRGRVLKHLFQFLLNLFQAFFLNCNKVRPLLPPHAFSLLL